MAYSFAQSERERYGMFIDKSEDKRVNMSLSESQHGSDNAYLDLGFAWLNEYDKDGNYHASNRHATQNENSRTTRRSRQRRHRQEAISDEDRSSSVKDLQNSRRTGVRETDEDVIRSTRARRHARRKRKNNDLRETNTRDLRQSKKDEDIGDNNLENTTHVYANRINRDQSPILTVRDNDMNSNNSRRSRQRKPAYSDYYGMDEMGRTLHSRGLQSNKTAEENLYDSKAFGATQNTTAFTSNIQTDANDEENPYGWKALGATRIPTFNTPNVERDEYFEENPYGWKALGATRKTSSNKKNMEAYENDEENPYGWKALGATRVPTSNTQNIETDENVEDNPYGWKALGATRTSSSHRQSKHNDAIVEENPYSRKALDRTQQTHSSVNVTRDRTSRKRTFRQASMSKRRSHTSERQPSSIGPNTERRIARAKRLSILPEESLKHEVIVRDGDEQPIDVNAVIRNTNRNSRAFRDTAGGRGLRGTYDYAYTRQIRRESTEQIQQGSARNKDRESARHIQRESAPNIQRESLQNNDLESGQFDIQPVITRTRIPNRHKIHWAEKHAPDQSVKRWTDIATDYVTMRKWHEMFVKIKKRWAANYKDPSILSGISGSTGFRPGTIISRSFEKKRQLSGRRRHAIICAVVFLVLLVAVVVPVSILTSGKESTAGRDFNQTCTIGQSCRPLFSACFNGTCTCPDDRVYNESSNACTLNKLMLYDIEVAINETYLSEMSDNSTEEFRSIAQLFCNQIDAVDQSMSSFIYKGCLVTSLGNGSFTVTVMWNLVLEITDDNQPSNTTILEKFGLKEQDVLGSFLILRPTIIHSSKQISANETATFSRRDFNQKCTFGQSCRPVFSDCINGTCTCPDHRLFNVSTGTCTLAEL